VAATVNTWIQTFGFTITPDDLTLTAKQVGEATIIARTGGAPTLAVGMAQIFKDFLGGSTAYWYHFVLLFEALFILTTVDAGTRVGRFLLQDLLGHVYKPLGDGRRWWVAMLVSGLIVAGWGYFMLASIADPNGGVRALLPLFGIANQVLAAIALAIGTVIIIRMGKARWMWMTVIPLIWLSVVTLNAGWIKITDRNPAIGFLANADARQSKIDAGTIAQADLSKERTLIVNQKINATLCGTFMSVIITMLGLCAWEAWLLLSGRKPLRPDVAVSESAQVAKV
jgi:carbon starvation protein